MWIREWATLSLKYDMFKVSAMSDSASARAPNKASLEEPLQCLQC